MSSIRASHRTTQKLLLPSGVASFRQVIQSHLDHLRQAPILLISSTTPPITDRSIPNGSKRQHIADACQFTKFTLAQQFGLRTVDTHVSSAFCTLQDINTQRELMQRTGAASIVAVGSGAAMDLAKAVQREHMGEESSEAALFTMMVPATYGAVLASGASHSLLLDSIEEKLVPFPKQKVSEEVSVAVDSGIMDQSTTTFISPLDATKYMEPRNRQLQSILLHAVATILLDTATQQATHPSLPSLLDTTVDLLLSDNVSDVDQINGLLFQSAFLLSYGLPGDSHDRSISMALLASLLPTVFPLTHPTSFLASLVPGLMHLVKTKDVRAMPPQLQTLMNVLETQSSFAALPLQVHDQYEGFSVPDMAVSCVDENQHAWNCLDAPTDVLLQVLQHSLASNQ